MPYDPRPKSETPDKTNLPALGHSQAQDVLAEFERLGMQAAAKGDILTGPASDWLYLTRPAVPGNTGPWPFPTRLADAELQVVSQAIPGRAFVEMTFKRTDTGTPGRVWFHFVGDGKQWWVNDFAWPTPFSWLANTTEKFPHSEPPTEDALNARVYLGAPPQAVRKVFGEPETQSEGGKLWAYPKEGFSFEFGQQGGVVAIRSAGNRWTSGDLRAGEHIMQLTQAFDPSDTELYEEERLAVVRNSSQGLEFLARYDELGLIREFELRRSQCVKSPAVAPADPTKVKLVTTRGLGRLPYELMYPEGWTVHHSPRFLPSRLILVRQGMGIVVEADQYEGSAKKPESSEALKKHLPLHVVDLKITEIPTPTLAQSAYRITYTNPIDSAYTVEHRYYGANHFASIGFHVPADQARMWEPVMQEVISSFTLTEDLNRPGDPKQKVRP